MSDEGELTLEGYIDLQVAAIREDNSGDGENKTYVEAWQMLEAMGYNRKLELVEVCTLYVIP